MEEDKLVEAIHEVLEDREIMAKKLGLYTLQTLEEYGESEYHKGDHDGYTRGYREARGDWKR